MKKRLLSAAIALALPMAASAADTWTLVTEDGESRAAVEGTPTEIATKVINDRRKAGAVGTYAVVDHSAKEVRIEQGKPEKSGRLADYLPDDIDSQSDLSNALPLMRDAAYARGGSPKVDVGRVEQGSFPVQADYQEKDKPYTAGVVLSSFGPRYSGENVASVFAQGGFGGYIGSVTYSEGMAFLTPDEAKGGHYHGISGELKRPTPYGTPVFGFQYSDYKQGGDARIFDLNGNNTRLNLGYERPFGWGVPSVNLVYGKQESDIGLVGAEGSQSYYALQLAFEQDRVEEFWADHPTTFDWEVTLTRGLSTDTSGTALGRENLDSNFEVAAADVQVNQSLPKNFMAAFAFGAQLQNGTQPNQLDFYLGGINRGSGYRSGAASSLDGAYGSVRFYTPNYRFEVKEMPVRLRPFVGYNQASGEPAVGRTLRAASAELGTQIEISKYLSGEIGYAWITDDQGPHEDDGRLIFNLVSSF